MYVKHMSIIRLPILITTYNLERQNFLVRYYISLQYRLFLFKYVALLRYYFLVINFPGTQNVSGHYFNITSKYLLLVTIYLDSISNFLNCSLFLCMWNIWLKTYFQWYYSWLYIVLLVYLDLLLLKKPKYYSFPISPQFISDLMPIENDLLQTQAPPNISALLRY